MTLGPKITINGGIDALTGKKKQHTLTSDFLTNTITFTVAFFETDNITPAIPAGNNNRQKQAVASYEVRFDINDTLIDPVTKVFGNPVTGVVAGVGIVSGGTGYTAGTKTTTGGTGTGLTVNITIVGGIPNPTISIVTPGSGYTVGDIITISGGVGATFSISSTTSTIPVGAINLSDYFLNKVITTYPSVGQNDTSAILVKGWFKEVIAILELNNVV
jgi:hypothetical protein